MKHKNIELPCSFFVTPRNGPTLLGMPDCEKLQLMNEACITIDTSWKKDRSVNNLDEIGLITDKH